MSKQRKVLLYIFFDWLCALLTWVSFYIFRKLVTDSRALGSDLEIAFDINFYLGIVLVPVFWLGLYLLLGAYRTDLVYHKSRFKELVETFNQTIIGSLILFFVLILDDLNYGQVSFVYSFLFLLIVQFVSTAIVRFSITHYTKRGIYSGRIKFNTLLIGSSDRITQFEDELKEASNLVGYNILGYLDTQNTPSSSSFDKLGLLKDAAHIIQQYEVEVFMTC
jgi:FlaA1/EpsC-like NDP-sugar epimerase